MRTRIFLSELRYGVVGLSRSGFPLLLTFVFPFVFLILFNSVGDPEGREGTDLSRAQFTLAAVAVFTIATSAYFNLPISVVNAREKGLLRRIKVSSRAPYLHMAARSLIALVIAAISVLVATVLSVLLFDLEADAAMFGRFLVLAVLAGISLSAVGLLVANFVKNIEGALVVYSASLFPSLFVSGVFFPVRGLPEVISTATKVLPFYWAGELARWVYRPDYEINGGLVLAVAVLCAWLSIGGFLAVRRFRWVPYHA